MDHLVEVLTQTFNSWGLSKEIVVFIISMLPLLELRGGILAAALLRISLFKAMGLCLIGNILPIPFILAFITPIFTWLKGTKVFKPMVEKIEGKAMSKSDQIQKYEFWGLMLFVGIPLPGTGAWTGALIAALMGIKVKKAATAIFFGIVMAMAIMCIISYLIPYLISLV